MLLKPNNKKFYVDNLEDIKEFLNNFLFGTSNVYKNISSPVDLSEIIDMFTNKKNQYIFLNWKFVYFILKLFNILGIKLRINTDSLLSIWGED